MKSCDPALSLNSHGVETSDGGVTQTPFTL